MVRLGAVENREAESGVSKNIGGEFSSSTEI